MNPDTILAITAIAAVGISIISMAFTVLFSKQQMKHNKNSVRPICEIKISDYENLINVCVANVGTGPLTIKSIQCDDTERLSPVLLALMPRIDQQWTTFTENVTGWTIPVNGKITLVELNPRNDENKYRVRKILSRITINIVYSDIYGTTFEKQRRLDFFGRNLDVEQRIFDDVTEKKTK